MIYQIGYDGRMKRVIEEKKQQVGEWMIVMRLEKLMRKMSMRSMLR